ncbi:hypothetical protein Rhe02_26620 [Rhizocola hellebori]|uniref:Cardiolipin synthase N-terminal domain-containing protein n=1 Tax=Rhizocola hellebori TaxID=1392758 RepID=A0A8J3Q7P6_9ACTN|nr:PLDc N-terminal domain-containing protein [Rhizocola hellebori]GIH04595.1 hypothetical protein Rhe02_26620 [Rhizocola hellebori]
MARFWLFFVVANLILTAAALISCLSAEDEDIRGLPRIGWVIVILLFSPVGSIVWFFVGKTPYSVPRKQVWRPGSGFPENERPRRTVAPDDDPDFLKGIERNRRELEAAQQTEAERELLRKWEEDLRRREDDLNKRDKPDD